MAVKGGVIRPADDDCISLAIGNDSYCSGGDSRWFVSQHQLQPGDNIVEPFNDDLSGPSLLRSAVTAILGNTATSVAAVNSF
jgi:hypothetical protein